VIQRCGQADALLVQWAPITRRVLEALPRVRCIVRYGVGVNNFDLDAARDRGVTAVNVPDYCMEEVSNHALAMMLSLGRRIHQDHHQILSGVWNIGALRPIPAFIDLTLGLVSFGRIAQKVAAKAKVFGFRIIAFDPHLPDAVFLERGVERVDFDALLQHADILSLHCPLLPTTRHLVNRDTIGRMKPGVILINTARGPIVNEADLVEGLRSGKIGAAGLDVFEEEPLPTGSPLRAMPGVLLTSHAASVSERSVRLLQIRAAEAARDFLQGRRPLAALV
jgi:D-3-phosphoglycerate dehydrogenase